MTKLTKDVECMEMIRRNLYLNKIRPFIDQDLIKVLIGLRRSGKTILLSQIRDVLLERGVSEENIIEINFESRRFKRLEDADNFYQYVMERAEQAEGKVYLFFDEIQHVKEWHSVIPSFRIDFDCDIYVTGSNGCCPGNWRPIWPEGMFLSMCIPLCCRRYRNFMRSMASHTPGTAFYGLPEIWRSADAPGAAG